MLSNTKPITKVPSFYLSGATNVGIEEGLLFHIRLSLAARFRFEVIPGQISLEDFKCLFWSIGHLKERTIPRRNCALIDQYIEVEDAVPVSRTVNHDADLLSQLLGLHQGEHFKHFVESAEAARENHQCFSQVRKPIFAHEEIVKLKIQRRGDVGVGSLFERQPDVEAHRLAA